MSQTDPLSEFGRIIKQVKVQEYERGWREAMEAIQTAANTLREQAGAASEAAAEQSDAEPESAPAPPKTFARS